MSRSLRAIVLCLLLCWLTPQSSMTRAQPAGFPSLPSLPSAAAAGGGGVASSAPLSLTAAQQSALASAASLSGYSLSEAMGIIQTAAEQRLELTTPPTAQPASCPAVDNECGFYRACYGCYANQQQPHCLPCLALRECQGVPPCETQRACKVCATLPSSAFRPDACGKLHC